MIADLATYSLAFHGPVCAFLWLIVLKLGGESEFGTKTLEDIEKLRARLLRAIAVSLKGVFEPILMDASTVNVSSLVLPEQDDGGRSRGITKLGEEKLLNAVRDFVKSDIVRMKSLRSLDVAELHITRCLRMLRACVTVTAIFSGVSAVASLIIVIQWAPIAGDWALVTAFTFVVACLTVSAFLALRIMLAGNRFYALKGAHADL